MALQLKREWDAVIEQDGDKAVFHFRQPSNKELNDFLGARYSVGRRNRMNDNSLPARCEFFDRLLTGVDDLVDPDGQPITAERKDAIPVNWKGQIIFEKFESDEVDVKN